MPDTESMANRSELDPRVFFAAERTFLSWLRTGLAVMGFGFVVARFGLFLREIVVVRGGPPPAGGFSPWLGIGLIGLGVLIIAAAIGTHIATVRRLVRGDPFVGHPSWLGILIAILLVIVGLLLTVSLLQGA